MHCDCTQFRTTGETQDEFWARHARQMCERPGGRGHEWDEEHGDCVNCGIKKEDFAGRARKG